MPRKVNKSAHAERQAKHYAAKLQTHVRKQVWVPKEHIEEFEKTLKRFFKKKVVSHSDV